MPKNNEEKKDTTEEKVDKEQSEKVLIDKDKLNKLLERMERLEYAADKSQLSKFDNANRGELGKSIRLITLEGKVVKRWSAMPRNVVAKDSLTMAWKEEQKISLEFFDTSKVLIINYVDFARNYGHLKTTVKKESKNHEQEVIEQDGEVTYTVIDDSGKTYEVGSKFIN